MDTNSKSIRKAAASSVMLGALFEGIEAGSCELSEEYKAKYYTSGMIKISNFVVKQSCTKAVLVKRHATKFDCIIFSTLKFSKQLFNKKEKRIREI